MPLVRRDFVESYWSDLSTPRFLRHNCTLRSIEDLPSSVKLVSYQYHEKET